MKSSSQLVHTAYRLLKQDSYYDKMDLFLHANIAAYEAEDSFQELQDTLAAIIDDLRKESPSSSSKATVKVWLNDVDFRLLPKSVELQNGGVPLGVTD